MDNPMVEPNTAKILRVDLGERRLWSEDLDSSPRREYMGGSGLVAWILGGKEIDIITARGRTPLTWERSLRLVASGCIDFGPLTADRVPLAEAVAGFERHSKDRDIIKLIVEP